MRDDGIDVALGGEAWLQDNAGFVEERELQIEQRIHMIHRCRHQQRMMAVILSGNDRYGPMLTRMT